jgi:hypothetical protein
MPRRFFELAVRARHFVGRITPPSDSPRGARLTGRRQVGGDLTRFSFRLAFVIDLTYVGLGALGGAALGRAAGPAQVPSAPSCVRDSLTVTRTAAFADSGRQRLAGDPPARTMR